MKKIICYELNEVPWKVVDFYIKNRRNSSLEKLLKKSEKFTSHTKDKGELHPWSTWPTMHRGVCNTSHDINFLNQDISIGKNFPPIWDILINSNKTVGIFGSLQSGGPIIHENVKFHIPDTFSPSHSTKPNKYESFQKLNLNLTNRNKATASKINISDMIDALKLFGNGLTLKASVSTLKHLFNEFLNKHSKSLRPTIQAVIAFDIFKHCLKNTKPDFVTFFTNHVAGIMHRYWKYSFPEDFNYELSNNKFDRYHKKSILRAMDIADTQIKYLMKFARKNSYDIVVCSSMGQEAINRGEYIPEIKLEDFESLKKLIKFDSSVKLKMAMQPDIVFEFECRQDLDSFIKKMTSIKDTKQKPIFEVRYPPKNLTLNLKSIHSSILSKNSTIIFDGENYSLKKAGFSTFKRDIGTGYHQPYGIIIWNKNNPKGYFSKEKTTIDSRRFAPTILNSLDVNIPEYMEKPISLNH